MKQSLIAVLTMIVRAAVLLCEEEVYNWLQKSDHPRIKFLSVAKLFKVGIEILFITMTDWFLDSLDWNLV